MKKILFKYWLANITLGFLLYVIHRIIISDSNPTGETDFKKFLFILEILLNLGFSLLYLAAVLVSSLTLFLNLFAQVRNNFFASLLTFLGIPLAGIIYLLFINFQLEHDSHYLLLNLLILSVIYILFTGIQFLMFRKKIGLRDDLQKNS